MITEMCLFFPKDIICARSLFHLRVHLLLHPLEHVERRGTLGRPLRNTMMGRQIYHQTESEPRLIYLNRPLITAYMPPFNMKTNHWTMSFATFLSPRTRFQSQWAHERHGRNPSRGEARMSAQETQNHLLIKTSWI